MPTLSDIRKTLELELPSYPGSKIVVYDSLLVTQVYGSEDAKTPLESYVRLIKSWNFTDEDGKDLPVTVENLGRLKATDFNFIVDRLTEFRSDSKKDSAT